MKERKVLEANLKLTVQTQRMFSRWKYGLKVETNGTIVIYKIKFTLEKEKVRNTDQNLHDLTDNFTGWDL